MVYMVMWNQLASANWAHFALTLASLRGEPITTSIRQSGAKITKIPPSSPRAGTRSSQENVHSLVSHSVSNIDTHWNHTSPCIHYLLMTLHPSETMLREESKGKEEEKKEGR